MNEEIIQELEYAYNTKDFNKGFEILKNINQNKFDEIIFNKYIKLFQEIKQNYYENIKLDLAENQVPIKLKGEILFCKICGKELLLNNDNLKNINLFKNRQTDEFNLNCINCKKTNKFDSFGINNTKFPGITIILNINVGDEIYLKNKKFIIKGFSIHKYDYGDNFEDTYFHIHRFAIALDGETCYVIESNYYKQIPLNKIKTELINNSDEVSISHKKPGTYYKISFYKPIKNTDYSQEYGLLEQKKAFYGKIENNNLDIYYDDNLLKINNIEITNYNKKIIKTIKCYGEDEKFFTVGDELLYMDFYFDYKHYTLVKNLTKKWGNFIVYKTRLTNKNINFSIKHIFFYLLFFLVIGILWVSFMFIMSF